MKKIYVVGVIKAQSIRWLGHVQRMMQERIPKAMLWNIISSKQSRESIIQEDLRGINLNNWKRRTNDNKV